MNWLEQLGAGFLVLLSMGSLAGLLWLGVWLCELNEKMKENKELEERLTRSRAYNDELRSTIDTLNQKLVALREGKPYR